MHKSNTNLALNVFPRFCTGFVCSRAFACALCRLVQQCTFSIFSRPRQWWVAEYLDINIGSIYSRTINACLEPECIFSHYLKRQKLEDIKMIPRLLTADDESISSISYR